MKRLLALGLIVTLLAPGCAATRYSPNAMPQTPAAPMPDRELMISYLKQLPIGAKVRTTLRDGKTLRGTLMKVGADAIVLQPRTRIPEPPVDITVDQIRVVELDANGHVGRTIGLTALAAAGATVGVLLILAAMLGD